MPQTKQLALFLLLALTTLGPLIQSPARATTTTSAYFDYVVVILLENRGINQTYGAGCLGNCSYITQLADQNGFAKGYSAVIHDSLPNYLALTSGWTQRLKDMQGDCSPLPSSGMYCPTYDPQIASFPFTTPNIVDRIESSGLTWKAYMEDFPTKCAYPSSQTNCSSGNCYIGYGGTSGKYDSQHDPFVYYNDITNNTARCSKIVPANSGSGYPDDLLINDLRSTSTASNLMWLTPNLCDDMHDTCSGTNYQTDNGNCPPSSPAQCVTQGNAYLSNLVPQILSSNIFTSKRAALFVTFDEGQKNYPQDYVTSVWAGPVIKTNYKSAVQYSHYSFLKTVEANWGFQPFNQTNDGQANAMTEFFIPPSSNSGGLPLTTMLAIGIVIAAAVVIAAALVIRLRRNRAKAGSSPEPATSKPA